MRVAAENDAMIQAFARAVEQAGGKAYLVGGIVRDEILGLPSKDYDFEIFGLPMEKVNEILKQFGNVKEVGQHFGVLHIQELDWDVALPRREKKSGEGHKGFDVVPDPTMTVEEAARRRDLTINALSKDPLTGQIIDPLGGVEDLKNGVLRAADPNTFGDDPLRALRVAQFAARFDFDVEPNTLQIVAAQPLEQLPGERIFTEFQKMLLKGQKPSKGIETLRQANLLRYFPEIEALQGVPQDVDHHPEGDVYVHTMMVVDEAARQRKGDPAFDMPLMFGALAHDFGKPEFTQDQGGGKVKSLGHEEGGEIPARQFMNRMRAPKELTSQVAALVSNHLRPVLMPERAKGGGYRRLGRKLNDAGVSFDLLVAVSKSDTLGRSTDKAMRRDTTLQDKFLQEANEYVLKAAPPGQKPLEDTVKGRDLIQRGFKPGPEMGKFLQLTRHIEDETGLKDADKIIDLANRFLENLKEKGGEDDCGDSHIRPGETCYDGKYDEMRKKGLTDSAIGRPCGDEEAHPDKCTGPGSSTKKPQGRERSIPEGQNPEYDLWVKTQQKQAKKKELDRKKGNLQIRDNELSRDPEYRRMQMLESDPAGPGHMKKDASYYKRMNEWVKAKGLHPEPKQGFPEISPPDLSWDNYAKPPPPSSLPRTKSKPEAKPKPSPGSGSGNIPRDWKSILKYLVFGPEETKSSQGPDGFRVNPDPNEPDRALWHDFDWPDKSGFNVHHPGLATAEPAREHKRSLTFQPRWFDVGTKWSERHTEPSDEGSRDGFGGSLPYSESPMAPPVGPPEDEEHWTGVTPEPGIPGTAEEGPEFPVTHPPANKMPGFFPWDEPPNQLLTLDEPHPSPMRAGDEPGFQRHPGGGGLDRAPMIRPQGEPKPKGFLPVVNLPGPENMFKAAAKELLPGGRADGLPDSDFDAQDLKTGEDKEIWEHGVDRDTAKEISKDHLVDCPHFYDEGGCADQKCCAAEEHIPGGKAAGVPDSNFDQHELDLGIKHESDEHGPDEKIAKEVAKDHLMEDSSYYSRKTRKGLDPEVPNKEKNQTNVKPAESVEGAGVPLGPGSNSYKNRTGKGFDKSREQFDYDYTGKKAGFLNMDLPKEDVSKSARTIEDLQALQPQFPRDYNPEWEDGGHSMGPSMKHRNQRNSHDMGLDPFPGPNGPPRELFDVQSDNDMLQKQVQPLIPNQKLAIAIDPKGQPGNRIVLMSPLFPDVSPAIQALRSQRFEKHGAVVVDGPPLWLMGLEGILQSIDMSTAHESSDQLFQKVIDLASQKGLTIDYTQEPRP